MKERRNPKKLNSREIIMRSLTNISFENDLIIHYSELGTDMEKHEFRNFLTESFEKQFLKRVKEYRMRMQPLTQSMNSKNISKDIAQTDIFIDFKKKFNMTHVKPKYLIINGKKIDTLTNWSDILLEVVNYLSMIQPQHIRSLIGKSINGNRKIDINDNSIRMINPKKLNCGLFIEMNNSASDTINKISKLLEICNIKNDVIKIAYIMRK